MSMTYDEIRRRAHEAADAVERGLLTEALAAHGWRLTHTASALGCTVSTLAAAVARHPGLGDRIPGKGAPRKPKCPES